MKTVLIHIFKVSEPAVALMLPLISLSHLLWQWQ